MSSCKQRNAFDRWASQLKSQEKHSGSSDTSLMHFNVVGFYVAFLLVLRKPLPRRFGTTSAERI